MSMHLNKIHQFTSLERAGFRKGEVPGQITKFRRGIWNGTKNYKQLLYRSNDPRFPFSVCINYPCRHVTFSLVVGCYVFSAVISSCYGFLLRRWNMACLTTMF